MVYQWYILPIGGLYITYHLLRELKKTLNSGDFGEDSHYQNSRRYELCPNKISHHFSTKTGWWFQPISKTLVKMGSSSPRIGVKIKHIWNHHLEWESKGCPPPNKAGNMKPTIALLRLTQPFRSMKNKLNFIFRTKYYVFPQKFSQVGSHGLSTFRATFFTASFRAGNTSSQGKSYPSPSPKTPPARHKPPQFLPLVEAGNRLTIKQQLLYPIGSMGRTGIFTYMKTISQMMPNVW